MEQLATSYVKSRMGSVVENDVFAGGLMLLIVGVIGAYLHTAASILWEKLRQQFIVSLEVRKEDESFPWLMKWLAHNTNQTNGRELSMMTARDNHRERWEGAEAANRPTLFFGPAPGLHFYRYRGRWISVERTVKDNSFGGGGGSTGLEVHEIVKLSTFGRDPQVLKDLARDVMNHSLGEELGKTLIFQPKYGWDGQWRKLMAIEKRAISSVHFPAGVLEELLADVREFFAMRDWYKRRGVPHRRGIMLYGPPGCGKSSFASALAGELGLNLCVISLANGNLDDDSLQEHLRKMPKGSILLLEDIDSAFVQRTKNTEGGANKNKVTFSGLLNALDGAVAFEGSLVLMTTNHMERLDAALTRPGRVDLAVRVGLARRDQIERLFRYFYQPWEKDCVHGEEDALEEKSRTEEIARQQESVERMARLFAEEFPEDRLSMASIQGYLLRYKLNPQAAIDNVERFIAEELKRMDGEGATLSDKNTEEQEEKGKTKEVQEPVQEVAKEDTEKTTFNASEQPMVDQISAPVTSAA